MVNIRGIVSDCASQVEVNKHLELGRDFLARGQLSDALTHYHAAVGELNRPFFKFKYILNYLMYNNTIEKLSFQMHIFLNLLYKGGLSIYLIPVIINLLLAIILSLFITEKKYKHMFAIYCYCTKIINLNML